MKAFVTGATGFVGSNLIEKLVKEEWLVTILATDPKVAKKIFLGKKIKIIKGNLLDPKSLRAAALSDVIFNLAGALPHHHSPEKMYWDVNVQGVKNLLETIKNRRIKRFIHVSTVGIYGSQNNIISETSPLNLETIYARTKYEGESLVKKYYEKHKIPTTIKPTIAYGPRDVRPGFKDLFQLIKKNRFLIVGNGKNHFHTIYIENLIDALLLAVVAKNAIGQDFIIGDEPCPTIGEIVKEIALSQNRKVPSMKIPLIVARIIGIICDIGKKLNLPSPLPSSRVKFITEERRYSINKAKKILGWKPKISLESGINKTYVWYRENKII